MSALERRYRRALRLLPGWYRERWEQDMVAALLSPFVRPFVGQRIQIALLSKSQAVRLHHLLVSGRS